jgi:protoporphyrinogen oxidase
LRNPSLAFPTLLARAGSLGDKWNVFQLTRHLQSQSAAQMFIPDGLSTHQFLVDYGFSKQIIDNFFVPFFGGIFLERKLETPASMFRFVFRNFALGSACLPAKGMQALPDQLLSRLQNAELRYLTSVEKISKDKSLIHLKSGEELSYNHLIIACDPSHFFAEAKPRQKYRNTVTMYFAGSSTLQAQHKTIGLDARSNSPVNNFCRHDEVQPECAPEGKSLWSVTVRDGEETTTTAVGQSLAELIHAPTNALSHLKTYQIARALPVVDTPRYDLTMEETRYDSRIFLAGDYLLNGSIEAALRSGERAAEAVIRSAENQ